MSDKTLSVLTSLTLMALTAGLPLLSHAEELRSTTLLSQPFDVRAVHQIEIGDFHFLAGQTAPRHTHAAPVFGYVTRGSIYYQVEGQTPRVLKAGEAFYEPVGPQILHFDNASTTEEAGFVDVNFERKGEPPIIFPVPPTESIDRRSLPSALLNGLSANTMRVDEERLAANAVLAPRLAQETVVAYVASGNISVAIRGEPPVVYGAGQTFYQPRGAGDTQIKNASTTTPATVVRFRLSNDNAK